MQKYVNRIDNIKVWSCCSHLAQIRKGCWSRDHVRNFWRIWTFSVGLFRATFRQCHVTAVSHALANAMAMQCKRNGKRKRKRKCIGIGDDSWQSQAIWKSIYSPRSSHMKSSCISTKE